MDLSKLPHRNQTERPTEKPADAPPDEIPVARQVPHARAELAAGPEVFINVIVGLLLLYMGWPLFDFLIHKLTGRAFNYPVTGPSGPIPFMQSVFFWMHLGTVLFGIALIAYALLGRSTNPALAWLALVLLGLAGAVSAYAVIVSLNVIGLQILPALCAAFAIYLGMYQWGRVKAIGGG